MGEVKTAMKQLVLMFKYLLLRIQLPTELRRFMYILIATQTSAKLG